MTGRRQIILALAVALGMTGGAAMAEMQQDGGVLEVSGSGSFRVVPDIATARLGVVAEADSPGQATGALGVNLDAVLGQLVEAGVPPKDIQTGTLTLSPVYEQIDPVGPQRRQRNLVGYTASSILSVRLSNIDGLSEVLDRVISAGANRFEGLSFGLADDTAAQDAALAAAVADALRRAAIMADAAGMGLGPILSVTEERGGGVPRPYLARAEMAMSDAPVPVAPGEVEISQSVMLKAALEPLN
ncbi:SIMPL domain-containing protein [Palleronia caenipelagi]|uniref:SIMPL domain-containing protein n=1 Tax=Palleronia caenipelagi TaxID=2489174 RepID=UPI00163D97EE|nr:SIMPL domain-containing protein [Palleronia caenipelagi]